MPSRRDRRGLRGGSCLADLPHCHMPFAPVTGRAPHVKAGLGQIAAQFAGARPGGDRGAGRRQISQGAQQRRRPHLRIALGCKAIQEKCVHPRAQPGGQRLRIAKAQCQRYGAVLEFQPVQPRQQRRPLRRKRARHAGQRLGRMARQQGGHVVPRKGVCFHRDDMQRRRPLRIIAPGLPQRQEVQPQPESRLADGERPAPPPALRQSVAPQENMLGLAHRPGRGVVDVPINGADQPAVGVNIPRCGDQRNISHRHSAQRYKHDEARIIRPHGRSRWMRTTRRRD
ncbi:hypothetical protein LMG26685_05127 [Achromobacter mucicolens]|nr:hypothetical protein LMG26685_05127 [Achromobacter mucicolens]